MTQSLETPIHEKVTSSDYSNSQSSYHGSSKKSSIVLFQPQHMKERYDNGVPLALMSIASVLGKEYDVTIIKANAKEDYKKRVIELAKDAVCVGITAYSGYMITEGLEVSRIIKNLYPNVKVIWGGYQVTMTPELGAKHKYIDAVVKGYAEHAFKEIVEAILGKKDFNHIKGIAFKQDGKIIDTGPPQMVDPNEISPLPYELYKEKILANDLNIPDSIDYESSRGCPYKCDFCAINVFTNRAWKGLSAERVVDDFERLEKEFKRKEVHIVDSNFFTSPHRVKEILRGMIKRNLKIVWEFGNVRVDQINNFDDEMWDLLKKVNCGGIMCGAESGCQEVLDLVGKNIKVADTYKAIDSCKKHGIKLTVSTFVGVPGVDFNKQLFETVKMIKYCLEANKKNDPYILLFGPYPGTPMFDLAIQAGFKAPTTLEGYENLDLYEKTTPWVSAKQAELVDLLHTTYILRFITGRIKDAIVDKLPVYLRPFGLAVHSIFYNLAKFRFKHNLYRFCLEYKLMKTVKIILEYKRGFRTLPFIKKKDDNRIDAQTLMKERILASETA